MSAHDHTTRVDGCFRCELSSDEAVCNEVADAIKPYARRLAEECPAATWLAVGHGYALVRADRWQR